MTQHLVLTIRFYDPRYHGTADWPPAPARVFQALVAGVARGSTLPPDAARALAWLEKLPPPLIAAPWARMGSRVELFVPNNDADAVGGDPANIGDIRVKKVVHPRLLEEGTPLIYAWPLTSSVADHAPAVLEAAENLYQLGRGIDMAWAVGEVVGDDALSARLSEHRGKIFRPSGGEGQQPLACPTTGSLESLIRRQEATAAKLRPDGEGANAHLLFSQPPKPRFLPVAYEGAAEQISYELRDRDDDTRLSVWPLARVARLTELLRGAAATRLREAFPERSDAIARALPDRGAAVPDEAATAQRVRITPLPSIGHEHVDRAARRVLVEVPGACPLRADDVHWAFSGLELGEDRPCLLVRSSLRDMLGHYRAEHGAWRWRSVTAVALPTAARRRIDPQHRREQAKGASERQQEEARAAEAIREALRQAGVRASAVGVRVQREPFEARGARAEAFADGTPFRKESLWHVELELGAPVDGMLSIGEGRFLGLGLLAPLEEREDIFGFALEGAADVSDPDGLVRAMRRAVMARAQREIRESSLDRFFSGHEAGGAPARSKYSNHLALQWDPVWRRLLVIAPHVLDRRAPFVEERPQLPVLRRALAGMSELRAGHAGYHRLARCSTSEMSVYVARAQTWVSVRPYGVTRHAKGRSAAEALTEDVILECERRGLPQPRVTVLSARGISGRGLEGSLRLDFAVAVEGPIVLGRTRYLGGGWFAPQSPLGKPPGLAPRS